MDGREHKTEQAEDALFAYMMAAVLELQGEEIDRLTEELEPMPGIIDGAAAHSIEKTFDQLAEKKGRVHTKKHVATIFSLLITVALIVTILYNAIPAVRVYTLNALIPIQETLENLRHPAAVAPSPNEKEKIILCGYQIPEVPSRFTAEKLVRKSSWEYVKYAYYFGDYHEKIKFFFQNADGGTLTVDTEDATVTPLTVHGCQGTVVEKEYTSEDQVTSSVIVVWPHEEQALFISVEAINLPRDTVIELAQQLVYVGTE